MQIIIPTFTHILTYTASTDLKNMPPIGREASYIMQMHHSAINTTYCILLAIPAAIGTSVYETVHQFSMTFNLVLTVFFLNAPEM